MCTLKSKHCKCCWNAPPGRRFVLGFGKTMGKTESDQAKKCVLVQLLGTFYFDYLEKKS